MLFQNSLYAENIQTKIKLKTFKIKPAKHTNVNFDTNNY